VADGAIVGNDELEIERDIDYLGHIAERLQDLTGFDTLAHELIQNAEDARATRIVFDVRDDELMVANDAVFQDCGHAHDRAKCPWEADGRKSCDWHNLRKVAAGQKRGREDTLGKFGVGLLAVYQVTDYPEIISARWPDPNIAEGRHWTLREDRPAERRIGQCPGTCLRHCRDVSGTLLVLPYARDPESTLRQALRGSTVGESEVSALAAATAAAAPTALIFLHHVTSIEVRRNGDLVSVATAQSDPVAGGLTARQIVAGDSSEVWFLAEGNFDQNAEILRRKAGSNQIEDTRRSAIAIAIPSHGTDAGRFFAGLPTEVTARLPYHVNADFFPSTDRKRLPFDANDYRGEWNRVAARAANDLLVDSLRALRDPLGAEQLWTLFLHLSEAQRQADPGIAGALALSDLWSRGMSRISNLPVAYTAAGRWVTPHEAPMLLDDPSSDTVATLAAIGIDPMDPALRSITLRLVNTELGTRRLGLDRIIDSLQTIGLDGPVLRTSPRAEPLEGEGRLASLWSEIARLLARERGSSREAPLRECAIAPSGNWLVPLGEAYRADARARRLVEALDLPVRLLDEDFVPLTELAALCPRLTPDAYVVAAEAIDAKDTEVSIASGSYRPEWLLEWLHGQVPDLKFDAGFKTRIRRLPLFATSAGVVALDAAVIPGNFEDPLGLSGILTIADPDRHNAVLAALGVRRLTINEYASNQVPRALAVAASADQRRAVVALLARHLPDIEADASVRAALESVALVECTDGEFRPAAGLIFESPEADAVLGSNAPRARQPESRASEALLGWLGVSARPTALQLQARIDELTLEPPNHDRVAALERIAVHLEGRVGEPGVRALVDELGDQEWLPARGDIEVWHAPDELHSVFRDYLFATQGQFLGFSREVQVQLPVVLRLLGLPSEPSTGQVVDHLLTCAEAGNPVNQQVWDFLNQNAADPALQRLLGRPVVDVEGAYRLPTQVFWGDHEFGRYRWKLGIKLLVFRPFFDAIGVRDEPGPGDAIAVIGEVAAEAGTSPVDDEDALVVEGCWRLLAAHVDEDESVVDPLRRTPSALDRLLRLVEPRWLYFEDRPQLVDKFPARVRDRIIAYDPTIAPALRAAGVRDLGEAMTVAKLETPNPRPAPDLDTVLAERSESIRRALIGAEPQLLRDLAEIELRRVDGILVQFTLHGEIDHPSTEPDSPDALFYEAEGVLYVRRDRSPWRAIARELAIALVGPRGVTTYSSPLFAVLAADDAADADAALTDLGFATLAAEEEFIAAPMGEATQLGGTEAPVDISPRGENAETTSTEPDTNPQEVVEAEVSSDEPPDELDDEHPGRNEGRRREGTGSERKPDESKRGGRDGKRAERDRTAADRGARQRAVLWSYVPAPSDGPDDGGEGGGWRVDPAVERAGVDAVLEAERAAGRQPKEMPPGHPGYDIESVGADGEVERYIEIKARSDSWSDPQIGPSARQAAEARERGERYWLYIVERALSPETREIHRIQDPLRRATHFGFDPGWMAVEEIEEIAEPGVVEDDAPTR
jgi:hypothetical protein